VKAQSFRVRRLLVAHEKEQKLPLSPEAHQHDMKISLSILLDIYIIHLCYRKSPNIHVFMRTMSIEYHNVE
jgi:hypothetical protein